MAGRLGTRDDSLRLRLRGAWKELAPLCRFPVLDVLAEDNSVLFRALINNDKENYARK